MTFGDRLKQLREARGLSQDQLAVAVNIARSSISHIEANSNGQRYPRQDKMERIADFLNVSLDYLLCRTDIIKGDNPIEVDWVHRAMRAETEVKRLHGIINKFISEYKEDKPNE